MTRPYTSDLRDEQFAATRERILTAAHRLLGTTRPVDLGYADVAREAGVSTRTLYRHFPTSDDLFLALSDRLLAAILGPDRVVPHDAKEALVTLRRQYQHMEADPALYRVFFAVPTRSRNGGEAAMTELFDERLRRVPRRSRRMVFGLMDLLSSPYAWDVLHANWGADAEGAYRASSAAIRAVLEFFEREPRVLERKEPYEVKS